MFRRLPVNIQPPLLRSLERHILAVLQPRVKLVAHLSILVAHVIPKVVTALGVHQALAHGHAARGIQDVDHRAAVHGLQLDSGVHLAGGRATDEQRELHAALLHLACHSDHLVKRGGDEPTQANEVGLVLLSGIQNLLPGGHDAHVDDLEVIAAQHHTDNVFANVVHIPLDGGKHHDACVVRDGTRVVASSCIQSLFLLNKWNEVTHCFLHHTSRLDDLSNAVRRAPCTLTCAHTCGKNILPAPKRSPTTFMPSMSGPSMTRRGLG